MLLSVVDDIYWEYEITEPLDLVVVQTRVVDSGELWISEGLGQYYTQQPKSYLKHHTTNRQLNCILTLMAITK